jgi:hypothetical protein
MDIPCRPEELAKEILKVPAKLTALKQSVIIVTRKGTWRRIVGQKGEAEKDKDRRAGKDQIGQDEHIKLVKIL